MKHFLIKGILFLVICLTTFYLVFYLADGYTDGMYLKFTSPKQTSLVLGTSKATQGIKPVVLNESLNRDDIYNYAFTVVHSPYGPYYFESIKRKLEKTNQDGIFILQVDPYSISSTARNPENPEMFREKETAVGMIRNVNNKPNLEYLLWHYPHQFIFIFKRRFGKVGKGFLHDDGWVETTRDMDSIEIEKRIQSKAKAYKRNNTEYKLSRIRLSYLEKTIEYLQTYGKVYLVRIPVAKPLFDLENELDPEFDLKMQNIAGKLTIPYFNFSEMFNEFNYSDGNHLSSQSSELFSKILAKEIIKSNNESGQNSY